MKRIAAARLMLLYAAANALLLTYAVARPGWAGMWAVFLTSFFMSLMFPTIFALGLEGLGPLVKLGGSLLVMAIVGGALLPYIMAWISQRGGIAVSLRLRWRAIWSSGHSAGITRGAVSHEEEERERMKKTQRASRVWLAAMAVWRWLAQQWRRRRSMNRRWNR